MVKPQNNKSSLNNQGSYKAGNILSTIIPLVTHILILTYIYGLEKQHCKCTRDWRHKYIKIYSIIIIVYTILRVFGGSFSFYMSGSGGVRTLATILIVIAIGVVIASIVNIYALFTYVGDLNEEKCNCATQDMKKLNISMKTLRWIYLVIAIMLGITILLGVSSAFLIKN